MTTPITPAAGSSIVPYAGLALQGAGTIFDIYQGIQNQKIADRNFQAQMDAYNRQQELDRNNAIKQGHQQDTSNVAAGADFGNNLTNNVMDKYRSFYASIGK